MNKAVKFLFALLLIVIASCSKEEDCVETICPDGFNNCIDRPCGL